MKFYYIYKSLAHPENNGYVQPFTLDERLLHVADAKKKLQTRFTWLCDSMTNDLKHALGDRPNSEFVFGPDGRIVVSRQWSSPADLRDDLVRLVGPVRDVTSIADLGMKPLEPPRTAPTGVVPRVPVPDGMTAVLTKPVTDDTDEPFYVKLRAEVDSRYASTGYGKLYLGLFLDPIHKVHWNNDAMPVMFEVESTTGVIVRDAAGSGPDVGVKADADPREFLLDLCCEDGRPQGQEIIIKVKYFACDDAETFCKPVTQRYVVTLQRDPDGGSRRSAGSRGRRPGAGGSMGGSRQQGGGRPGAIGGGRNPRGTGPFRNGSGRFGSGR